MHNYYFKDGKLIFTKEYHLKRGYCCGNFCLNCPFYPRGEKGSKVVDKNERNEKLNEGLK